LNLDELRGLLQLLDEKEIAEFELEEDGMKLRVRRAVAPSSHAPGAISAAPPANTAAAPVGAPVGNPARAAAPAGQEAAVAEEVDPSLTVVKSPIVGTFYRAADPNSPPFVQVGDRVRVGQVLCIIEAMKLMNEIESEVAGEVVRVHHENGQPVQYGEPLFSVRP
jgi:acetyl-CoA carboxylase biotin carboxyl carrier protein